MVAGEDSGDGVEAEAADNASGSTEICSRRSESHGVPWKLAKGRRDAPWLLLCCLGEEAGSGSAWWQCSWEMEEIRIKGISLDRI